MRAEEGNAKDLLCKSFVAEIKDMPLYERLNTKNEMRGIVFKCQMSLLDRRPSPSLQTEKLTQTMPGNSVPLGRSNINYPSALPDTSPTSSIRELCVETKGSMFEFGC